MKDLKSIKRYMFKIVQLVFQFKIKAIFKIHKHYSFYLNQKYLLQYC